ncbi:MAG TPA: response regulator [Polyangia bacterium]|jgi:CheY-like chemotaxis protein|nr:response regulator [Polyangia bacterium]
MWAGEGSRRPTLLIVDDDRDIREVLGEMLTDEGFNIEAAWNGAEALKRLHEGFRPNLIILDLMMPVMDGLAFREHLKLSPDLASIPVIGVTAASSAQVDFVCLRKPLRFDALVERIQTTLS